MPRIDITREIPASPENVWAVAADLRQLHKWYSLFSEWKGKVPETITTGTQIAAVVTLMGMSDTVTLTVDDYEAPKLIKLSGTGMAGSGTSTSFSIRPNGTRTTFSATLEFTGSVMEGAMGRMVERAASKALNTSVNNLTKLITAGTQAG
ncbi:carbon monoxide dehydrogenase subunit G [Mycobacterium frederiksbergense]|uniref:Carbon monoxide dehydrogenase subunit G n=1 Tax=Mycolicibacterium frederiksbergense TaxID=117567 RepID=A0ABT6KZH3_9MYCO|nr:SRPBCC family protein [Mycolicibacterium frederiksbergense]MDH6196069.1 carbon monoxide dehydrogenase subunit G [Mycolicibacterium frederiksbergense]